MIEKYLAKHYEWPPCWQLVADVYVNELGLCVDDYTPKTDSMRDVANAFRLALHDNKHGFTQQESANNFFGGEAKLLRRHHDCCGRQRTTRPKDCLSSPIILSAHHNAVHTPAIGDGLWQVSLNMQTLRI